MAPKYMRLSDHTLRARIVDLRSAVTPVLNGNYLPHFTDHSVDHSDRLCDLVDLLTEPLPSLQTLNEREAFVLYAACYLHDVGLQHQRANETMVVQQILSEPRYASRPWHDLDIATRRNIVRAQHHRISAELVRQSIDAPQPTPLGIQLTQDWEPGLIASLCIAHCLWMDSSDRDEYRELTQDWGSFRMSLLAALLRLADILDESRKRSQLHLRLTRELDLESRMHWWRHYYVAEITINPTNREIVLCFDFPADRREQYNEIIATMQIPWIKGEFDRQSAVLST
jgi:hypothetical protein